MEEVARAIMSLLSSHSTKSVRGKFARLREILTVLTADFSTTNIMTESFSHLTLSEVIAFSALRLDGPK